MQIIRKKSIVALLGEGEVHRSLEGNPREEIAVKKSG